MTLRVAVTGSKVSPPLFEVMEVLGKEETLARVDAALSRLA
jgi:glutamyl-tRNA synthetase